MKESKRKKEENQDINNKLLMMCLCIRIHERLRDTKAQISIDD